MFSLLSWNWHKEMAPSIFQVATENESREWKTILNIGDLDLDLEFGGIYFDVRIFGDFDIGGGKG